MSISITIPLPYLLANDIAYEGLSDMVHGSQCSLRYPSLGVYLPYFFNLIPCEFCAWGFVGTKNAFWVRLGAVLVSTSQPLWVKMRRVIIPSLQSLRMKARAVSISSCHALRTATRMMKVSGRPPSLTRHVVHVILMRPQPKMIRIHAGWVISRRAVVADEKPIIDYPLVRTIGDPMRKILFFPYIEKSVPVFVRAALPNPASAFGALEVFPVKPSPLSVCKNYLANVMERIIRILSGIHNSSMGIVRAFESLITARTLAPSC